MNTHSSIAQPDLAQAAQDTVSDPRSASEIGRSLVAEVVRLRTELADQAAQQVRAEGERGLLAEQLRQALEWSPGDVAHALNNIATTVLGFSELLSVRLAADPRSLDMVRDIAAAGERGKQWAQRLLRISQSTPSAEDWASYCW
jgi:hypothetical protein